MNEETKEFILDAKCALIVLIPTLLIYSVVFFLAGKLLMKIFEWI